MEPTSGKRLVVKAEKNDHVLWTWNGGFVEQAPVMGSVSFRRDSGDGGSTIYIYRHDRVKKWFIGQKICTSGSISFCTSSKDDADSPEKATWDIKMVQTMHLIEAGKGVGLDFPKLFIDPEFPHQTVPSITKPGDKEKVSLKDGEPEWVPGRCLNKGAWKLFDGISPQDLLQGQVGDCWLISAIASLAEFPREVRSIFKRNGLENPDGSPGDGKYELTLFDHTEGHNCLRTVVVDEYIPCRSKQWWEKEDGYQPYFAKPQGNELWCLILEKACAKIFGSYGRLSGGTASAGFRALTGVQEQILWDRKHESPTWKKSSLVAGKICQFSAPGSGRATLEHDGFFKHLQECDQQNFLLGASIDGGRETKRTDGLVEGHAYTMIHAMEIKDACIKSGSGTLRLVMLRNPWGDHAWNGAWCDGDRMWTEHPAIQRHLRPAFIEDGAFWMSWADFSNIFTSVFICPKAMREGDEAKAHMAASVDWRSFQPPRVAPTPPARSIMKPRAPEAGKATVRQEVGEGGDVKKHAEEEVLLCWQWAGGGTWHDYDPDVQKQLTAAFERGQSFAKVKLRDSMYNISLSKGYQENLSTGGRRAVRKVRLEHGTGSSPVAHAAAEAKRFAMEPIAEASFNVGDAVHVYSNSQKAWLTDGVVVAVLKEMRGENEPVGSVEVTFNRGTAKKVIPPQWIPSMLRKPE